MMKLTSSVVVVFLILLGVPALAQGAEYAGWGPRVGVTADPDQVVFGAHFVIDDIAENLRFVPNVELGFGDDFSILSVTAPVHYVFMGVDASFTPYAGGGLTLAYVDIDKPGKGGDDEDFEVAFRGIGGVQWRLQHSNEFFVELHLLVGDLQDVQVIAGWTFGNRQ